MRQARIAVFVSGSGSNLQALLDAQISGQLSSGQITLVVSDREGAFALQRAKTAGVPALVISRKGEDMERHLEETLRGHRIDLIVLAGYLTILSPEFVSAHQGRIINVHPSLLPAFGGKGYYGLKVHEAALRRGVKISGATVHIVTEEPDGGPIVLQKAVRVLKGDTPESLQKRIMQKAEWLLLPRAAEILCKEILHGK